MAPWQSSSARARRDIQAGISYARDLIQEAHIHQSTAWSYASPSRPAALLKPSTKLSPPRGAIGLPALSLLNFSKFML